MAIEFGSDNRPISTVFGSGTGANQEARHLQASTARMLGVRAGKCRSCGVAYVAGHGDVGRCTPCLSADAHVKAHGSPVSKLDMLEDGSVTPSVATSRLASERPLGADTLEDCTSGDWS